MDIIPIQFLHKEEFKSKVSDVFKCGRIISIKVSSYPVPIFSIIQRIEGDCLYFRVSEELLKSNVLLGDHLTCQIIENGYEYVLDGIVGDIEFGYPRELQFIIKNINVHKNMRKFRRYNVNYSAEVYINRSAKRVYTIVHNISIADLNMICKEHVELNDRVDVTLLIDKGTIVRFKARISRISKNEKFFECGMQIVEINNEDKNRLDEAIFKLEMEEGLLVNESLK